MKRGLILSPGVAWSLVGILLGLLAPACSEEERNELPFAPDTCEENKPERGPYSVRVTLNPENPQVPIAIFFGDIEEDHLALRDTLTVPYQTYDLFVDETYAATALYLSGPDTFLVIDAAGLEASKEQYRDKDCWSTNTPEVDLRLLFEN